MNEVGQSPTDKLSAVAVETLQRLTPELWEGLTLTSSSQQYNTLRS